MAELPEGRITDPDYGPNGIVGKTATHADFDGGCFGIRFSDGSWMFGRCHGDEECGGIYADWHAKPSPGDLLAIGVYTEAECKAAGAREADEERARKTAQLERLRKELGL